MNISNMLLTSILISVLLLGCKNEDLTAPKTPKMSENANLISPTAITPLISPVSPVGTEPAGQTIEAPATTSSSKSDVTKTDQSASMPLPGQANDHSALLPEGTKTPKTSP